MFPRYLGAVCLILVMAASGRSQVGESSRYKILHEVLQLQAATRIGLPAGGGGVEIAGSAGIDRGKLADQIKKHGESVPAGKFMTITKIEFSERAIEIELDGGGKGKSPILGKIQSGMSNRPSAGAAKPAIGTKIVLRFANKAPATLTPEALKMLLDPVLDFGQRIASASDSATPGSPEVADRQVRIGMDRPAVTRALGRPNNRVRETVDGVEREDWIYNGKGLRTTFVTFENDVVVGIREYQP